MAKEVEKKKNTSSKKSTSTSKNTKSKNVEQASTRVEKARTTKKQKKIKKGMLTMSILNIIFTAILVIFIGVLNVVPAKYLILITVVLLVVDIINLLLLKSKKKGVRILGYVISIVFMIISIVGTYYLSKTNDFLNKAFGNAEKTHKVTYYVVTMDNDEYEEISDIKDTDVGYYESMPNIEEALTKFKKIVKTENKSYDDLYKVTNDLRKGTIAATLVEKSFYNFLLETNQLNETEFKILHTFTIKVKDEEDEIKNDGNSFNIYIGGTDFTEVYTDFNMVVTVNKKNHKILLTSTPRDFYVELDGKGGAKDLLGYAGVWGINTSRKTVANLYGIDIDYYIKINTQSLVGLVNTLNGIEFCSDISFTTTHAVVTGTYDDTKGRKLNVKSGCNTYNGEEILTIARERKAYADGDRQRQKNCQQIMINIFKKMTNAENLTNYSNILNAVSDLYTTNIPKELVTELAKDTINNGSGWSFEQQSVTGSDSRGYVHLSNIQDYIMIPNEDSIKAASTKIKNVQKGK